MDQILRNTGAQRRVTFYADETAIDADGDVTVEVTRDAGTSALSTSATSVLDEPGTYEYSLPPQTDLDRLTETWTGVFTGLEQSITTQVEIVGGFYVTEREIRDQLNMGDEDRYPTWKLDQKRRWFETTAERYVGVAFVPRYSRVAMSGADKSSLILPHMLVRRLLSASIDDTAVSTDDLAAWTAQSSGLVNRTTWFPAGYANVSIAYEHGLDEPPEDLKEAALWAIRDRLQDQASGSRARSVETTSGIVRNSFAGTGHPIGIDAVDEVLNAYRSMYGGGFRVASVPIGVG